MRRRMIIGERIMYVDASTPLNCVFTVNIHGNLSPERLRNALVKIQQKHPLLRARIQEDEKNVPYFTSTINLTEIPVRIEERQGDTQWKTESEKEWSKLFNEKDKPLARVVWLKGEGVSDLMLVCPHCICDGTTFVSLMSDLLLLLDKPGHELTAYPAFNSIEGLLSKSYQRSVRKVFKARIFSVLAHAFFFLKSDRNKKPAGQGYMLHWKLDAARTTDLVSACKKEGVSVNAALSAAFLAAFQTVKGKDARGKIICPVDIRRFVEEIKTDHMFAFAPIAELSTGKNLDLWTRARKLKDDLDLKIAAINAHELLFMSEYFHAFVPKMVGHLRSTEGSHDLTFSNMGKLAIAESYESFEVRSIYSPTVGFPWRNANTAVVSTFKGEMDFTFYSNDSFLDPKDAEAIQEQAMTLL